MASIADLFITLGVKADTKALKGVSDSVKGLRKNSLLLVAAFTGAALSLDRFVNSALTGVVALQNLNAQTGLSIEKLQKFQQAGQLSNLALSADQIAQSIGNVQKNLAQLKIGQGNIAPFQLLGIDVQGEDAFGIIEQLRDSIKGVDPALASNLISQIGLNPEFINILKLSREEFDALGENVFLSGKQRADIDKVGTSIKALSLRLKALKDQAVAKLAPELDKLVKQFFKWIKDNGDKIIKTIVALARGFAKFSQALASAFSLAGRFVERMANMENGVFALAAAFAFLVLSFSPVLAGIAAIVLLLDDIAVFKAGGDSVIGELIKSFAELPKIFGDLPNIGKLLGGTVAIAGILKMTEAITGLNVAIGGLVKFLKFFSGIGLGVFGAIEVGKKVGSAGADKLLDTDAGNAIGEFLLDIGDAFKSSLDFFKNLKDGLFNKDSTNSALPSAISSTSSNNVTVNNNVQIAGVQNPTAVKSEVERSLIPLTQESLNRTFANQGNGIR
jgi:hypothetical protein